MTPNTRLTTRRAFKAVLLVVALEVALASYASLRAPVAPPESGALRAAVSAPVLPDEFRAIEPAGTDGSLPVVPVAEVWPAQR